MDVALDRPGPAALLTQWSPQPLALLAALALGLAYAYGVRRFEAARAPGTWSRRRSAVFAVGLLVLVWLTNGFPQAYAGSLYWVWTSQTLALWLALPLLLLSGHPLQLARAVTGRGGVVDRALRTRPARIVANPLVGPALVPVLSGVLFFGPLAGWAIAAAPVGWLLQLVLIAIGALMVLPLIGLDDTEVSSLAVGLSLAIGSFELVLDALPGVVLRLHTGLVTSWFDHRALHPWTPVALHDQQFAGGILWCIAELIVLPFLFLVFRRWIRVDARDAARVDAVLEAERSARQAMHEDAVPGELPEDTFVERDVPWWVNDPAMQQRLRRQG